MIIHTRCISWLDLKGFDLDLQYDPTAPTDANYGSKEAIRRARARSKGLSLRCERVILVYDVPVKSSPQYHWIILKFLRILTGIAHIFKTMPGLLWLEQTGRMTARKLLAKDGNDLLKPFVEIFPVGWPSHFLVGYLSQMSSAELTCPGPAAPSAEEAGLLGDKTLPNLSVIPFSCLPKRELTTYREQTYGRRPYLRSPEKNACLLLTWTSLTCGPSLGVLQDWASSSRIVELSQQMMACLRRSQDPYGSVCYRANQAHPRAELASNC